MRRAQRSRLFAGAAVSAHVSDIAVGIELTARRYTGAPAIQAGESLIALTTAVRFVGRGRPEAAVAARRRSGVHS